MAETNLPNEEDYKRAVDQLKNNDSSLTELNLNNLENCKTEWSLEVIEALLNNSQCGNVCLVNCNINNDGAKKLAEVIKNNKTLTLLNVESNKIGPDGMKALAEALEVNTTLLEVKLTNQAQPAGNDAEKALAKAMQANKTLQKCTITMRDTGARNSMDTAISRNRELARQARQNAKRK